MTEKSSKKKDKTKYIHEEEIIKLPESKEAISVIVPIKSEMQLFREFIYSNNQFQIFFKNQLVFDTSKSKKDQIIILNEGFQIFNKIYTYNGIRLKKIK